MEEYVVVFDFHLKEQVKRIGVPVHFYGVKEEHLKKASIDTYKCIKQEFIDEFNRLAKQKSDYKVRGITALLNTLGKMYYVEPTTLAKIKDLFGVDVEVCGLEQNGTVVLGGHRLRRIAIENGCRGYRIDVSELFEMKCKPMKIYDGANLISS